MRTAYGAAEGFEADLDEERRLAGVVVSEQHGRAELIAAPAGRSAEPSTPV